MRTPVTERYPIAFRLYPYVKSSDQAAAVPLRHKVVVAGGGPVGLATALDLGLRGVPVLVLDDQEGAGLGSRAICFAKRTLEICDRLGAGTSMLAKGVQWNIGKVANQWITSSTNESSEKENHAGAGHHIEKDV